MNSLSRLKLSNPLRIAFVIITAAMVISLVGCSAFPLTISIKKNTTVPQLTTTSVIQSTNASAATPSSPGSTTAAPNKLRIWVPPQFDPNGNTTAGNLLKARLAAFSAAHGNIAIEVRVKAASGPSGLLDALTTTSAAAPSILPDLIALDRDDLEAGAIKGLLYPYENITDPTNDPDLYNFARQLALVQDIAYGLPFAGDALIMAYRTDQVKTVPASWAGLIQQRNNLVFPASEINSLVTLALYESDGGKITDSQNRPALNADNLAKVLKIYQAGAQNGIFPNWMVPYDSDEQAWQSYKDAKATWVAVWASEYLAEQPSNTTILPFLPLDENSTSVTLATGWSWALGNSSEANRSLAIELAQWLTESSFLSQWTAAAGYIPTRPTSLASWSDQNLQSLLSQIAISAQLSPSSDLMVSLSPVINQATQQVLKLESDPVQAAQSASVQLKGP